MAAWTVIDHEELTGTQSSYDVTSIPSSYDHLMLLVSARSDYAANRDTIGGTVNGDTGGNYGRTNLFTGGEPPSSYGSAGAADWGDLMDCPGASVLADTFNVGQLWFPNYANTSNYKAGIARSSTENNSTTTYAFGQQFVSLLWESTAAIDQITLDLQSGDFVEYSSFTLYGLSA